MDTNNIKESLNKIIDTVMYLTEKDRQYNQILKRKDDKIKKSEIAYDKLLGDLKCIEKKNKSLCNENVYLKKRVQELNDDLTNHFKELDTCIEILEKITNS